MRRSGDMESTCLWPWRQGRIAQSAHTRTRAEGRERSNANERKVRMQITNRTRSQVHQNVRQERLQLLALLQRRHVVRVNDHCGVGCAQTRRTRFSLRTVLTIARQRTNKFKRSASATHRGSVWPGTTSAARRACDSSACTVADCKSRLVGAAPGRRHRAQASALTGTAGSSDPSASRPTARDT